jgi:hypothetical protein
MAHSVPNTLDYQKHGLDLHKSQIDLTKSRVDLMGKEPEAYEAEIGLIDDFQNSNQTRKSGWRALLDGMTSGLKYGIKSAEGEKKRATYANMEKMLGSFEEVGKQLQRQNEKNALRQENMETKVIPSAIGYLTYLQNNPTYDEAFNNLNSRVEQLRTGMSSQASLFDGELVALSPRNYEVGIFKDRKTGQLKETPISSLLPPDLLKGRPDLNTYERAKDAERMNLERQKADAMTLKAQNSTKGSDAQKQASLAADEEETRTYLELYSLLKNPDIDPTSSTGTGIKNWVAQNVPLVGGLVGEGLAKQQAYSQATANLKGQAFKKHGYRNQAEFENIHTLPDSLPRKEALKFVEAELRKKGIPIREQASLGQTSLGQTRLGQAETGGNVTGQIKVQDPSTGQIGLLSPEQAEIAIKRGGVRIE